MLPIAQALFPPGTDDFLHLKDILERLKMVEDIPSFYANLNVLRDLLEQGISCNFVPKSDHLDNPQIHNAWLLWLATIKKAITQYEKTATDNSYHSILPSADSTESRFLLLSDSSNTSSETSSNIEGLKFILLALLMLPKDETRRLNTENNATYFKRGTTQTELFPLLILNFKEGATFRELIYQCNDLILNKYKVQSGFRQFLTSIRNSLLLLDGYKLGLRRQANNTNHHSQKKKESSPRNPSTVRLTPFYSEGESSDASSRSNIVEIIPEEGEESILGVIEARTDDPDQSDISEEIASATSQVKSKRWLQKNYDTSPWNSVGINPFTQQILINWIKKNSSPVSLIFGLMLCTGKKIEDILSLRIGHDADFTIDGEYIKYYKAPEKSISLSSEKEYLIAPLNQVLTLSLPTIIKSRFKLMCIESDTGKILADAWDIDIETLKKETQTIVKDLILQGANGLAIDRIPLVLQKKVAEISQDEALGYIISSREDDIPPVSSYYTSYTHDYIESVYRQAVKDLYHG